MLHYFDIYKCKNASEIPSAGVALPFSISYFQRLKIYVEITPTGVCKNKYLKFEGWNYLF